MGQDTGAVLSDMISWSIEHSTHEWHNVLFCFKHLERCAKAAYIPTHKQISKHKNWKYFRILSFNKTDCNPVIETYTNISRTMKTKQSKSKQHICQWEISLCSFLSQNTVDCLVQQETFWSQLWCPGSRGRAPGRWYSW